MRHTEITTPPTCMDEHDPNSLSVEAAMLRIHDAVQPVIGVERCAIRDALDRISAEDIRSPTEVPSHDNSAMDGYAVRFQDLPREGLRELSLAGSSFAGHPYLGTLGEGECLRIMTGAVMPLGADTVIMQEHVERDDDRVRIGVGHKAGDNVRRAGEDIRVGDLVIAAGKRLLPAELGVLASLGIGEVSVRRKLRVAFFSTGDELRAVGEPLRAGDIYDSNRYTLYATLKRLGVESIDLGVVRDDRSALRRILGDAASIADAVITSGGVSVGEADYVKDILEEIGEVRFWKIAIKPGRPLAFGHIGRAAFFGLPGNPVSVLATYYQFVQPALRRMMGQEQIPPVRVAVRCESRLKKRAGRLELQRGILTQDSNGELRVHTTGLQGSHVLTSMSKANCFIILPVESTGVEPGEWVEIAPFEGLV